MLKSTPFRHWLRTQCMPQRLEALSPATVVSACPSSDTLLRDSAPMAHDPRALEAHEPPTTGGASWRRQVILLVGKIALQRRRRWGRTIMQLLMPSLVLWMFYLGNLWSGRLDPADSLGVVVDGIRSSEMQTLYSPFGEAPGADKGLFALRSGAQLAFTPDTPATRLVMTQVGRALVGRYGLSADPVHAYVDDKTLEAQFLDHPGSIAAAVQFTATPAGDPLGASNGWRSHWRFSVRMNSTLGPVSTELDDVAQGDPDGFVELQHLVSHAVLSVVRKGAGAGCPDGHVAPELGAQRLPLLVDNGKPWTIASMVVGPLSSLFCLNMLLGMLVTALMEEKETKKREALHVMGVDQSAYWWAWLVWFLIFVVPVTGLFMVSAALLNVFKNGNFLVTWLAVYVSALPLLAQSLFYTLWMKTMRSARLFLQITLWPFVILYFLVSFLASDSPSVLLTICVLSPHVGIMATRAAIDFTEARGTGLRLNTLGDGPTTGVDSLLVASVLSIIFWMCVNYYLSNILPSAAGVPLPWYFPCSPRFWSRRCGCAVTRRQVSRRGIELPTITPTSDTYGAGAMASGVMPVSATAAGGDGSVGEEAAAQMNHEPLPQFLRGQQPIISGFGLTKTFNRNKKTEVRAVRSVNIDVYEGEAFALLGHNGSGKSTTMNLLCATLPVDAGSIRFGSYGARGNLDAIRRRLGYVPQANELFDELTGREHLELFAGLKGVQSEHIRRHTELTASEVGLSIADIDKPSAVLSGGQKRKLHLAAALLGSPTWLILDEPTAGMDPASRRAVWQLLQRKKRGRAIILVTQLMHEANALGDRIGIMSRGTMYCSGTSLFLKHRWGIGYRVTATLQEGVATAAPAVMSLPAKEETSARLLSGDGRGAGAATDTDRLERKEPESPVLTLIRRHVPTASAVEHHGRRAVFSLPLDSVDKFPELLEDLEAAQDDLQVSECVSYIGSKLTVLTRRHNRFTVSMTTMEEVFLKTAEEAEAKVQAAAGASGASPSAVRGVEAAEGSASAGLGTMESVRRLATVGAAASNVAVPADTTNSAVAGALASSRRWEFTTEDLSPTFFRQWRAVLRLRVVELKRNRSLLFVSVVYPLIYIGMALLMMSLLSASVVQAPILQLNGATSSLQGRVNMFGVVNATGASTTAAAAVAGSSSLCTVPPSSPPSVRLWTSVAAMMGSNATCPVVAYPTVADFADAARETLRSQRDGTFSSLHRFVAGAMPAWSSPSGQAKACAGPVPDAPAVTVAYNSSIVPSLAAALGYMYDSTAKLYGASIQVDNYPLPTVFDVTSTFTTPIFFGVAFTLTVMFGPLMMASNREGGHKHLTEVMGMNPARYYVAHMSFDVLQILLLGALVVGMIVLLRVHVLMGANMVGFIALIGSYAFAVTTLGQMLALPFKKAATVVSVLPGAMMLTGVLPYVVLRTMRLQPGLVTMSQTLSHIFVVFPIFGLYEGMGRLLSLKDVGVNTVTTEQVLAFHSGVGDIIMWNCVGTAVYASVIYLVEYRHLWLERARAACGRGRAYHPVLADDPTQSLPAHGVRREARVADRLRRVAESRDRRSGVLDELAAGSLVVCGLTHSFNKAPGSMPAVSDLSLTVKKGELLVLLGPNGAGKTTTLDVLTGRHKPTAGGGFICGSSVVTDTGMARKSLGYCPQFHRMTGKEVIRYYCEVKGIPQTHLTRVIHDVLHMLDLGEHGDKLTIHYSGGLKRRLGMAVSLIGNPKALLCDEPSTGLDPSARRILWDAVAAGRQNRATLLSTHQMEEAEALATRIAILVDGHLVCVGSPAALKAKVGLLWLHLGQTSRSLVSMDPQYGTGVVVEAEFTGLSTGDRDIAAGHPTPGGMHVLTVSDTRGPEPPGPAGEFLRHLQEQFPGTQLVRYVNGNLQVEVPLASAKAVHPADMKVDAADALPQSHSDDDSERSAHATTSEGRTPSTATQLGAIFRVLEASKSRFHVTYYSVVPSDLESVFLRFTHNRRRQE